MASQRKQTVKENTMASSNSVVDIDTASSLDTELMTTRDVMAFLNFSRTKIWELVQHEQLPAFKLGGDYRYRRSEVIQWLERYRVHH
ncbi:MAG TPA: DNA-binding protein [Planctomycetaceae bacterium]|nr:DNA-binding protein [Planctomycetaceae bacterium]